MKAVAITTMEQEAVYLGITALALAYYPYYNKIGALVHIFCTQTSSVADKSPVTISQTVARVAG